MTSYWLTTQKEMIAANNLVFVYDTARKCCCFRNKKICFIVKTEQNLRLVLYLIKVKCNFVAFFSLVQMLQANGNSADFHHSF